MDYENSIFCVEDESNSCLPEIDPVEIEDPEIVQQIPQVSLAEKLHLKSKVLVAKFFENIQYPPAISNE